MTQVYKLTTVTRRDLTAGSQSVQSTHAAVQFIFEHPELSEDWFKKPYLAQLSVKNEDELKSLIHKLQKNNIKHSIFREPDLGNQITAIAIEPSEKTRRIVSHLPLMLKEYNLLNKLNKHTYIEDSYIIKLNNMDGQK